MDWQAALELQPALTQIPPALRERAEQRELGAGEALFRSGDRVQGLFAVISGEVRLVRRDRGGAEVILQRSRGGFIAEASLDSKAYHCDAVAAESGAMLLRFPVLAFRAELEKDGHFRNAWISLLAREVRRLRAQCERLSLRGAADRVIHYLEAEGNDGVVVLTQTRKMWAAELGLTHEALYRVLAQLRAEGRLEVDGPRLALPRPRRARR